MKKLLLVTLIALFAKNGFSQFTSQFEAGVFGYRPTNKHDTVAIWAITSLSDGNNSSDLLAIRTKARRTLYAYFGDPMPLGNYEPEWRIDSVFIDRNRYILWDYKVIR